VARGISASKIADFASTRIKKYMGYRERNGVRKILPDVFASGKTGPIGAKSLREANSLRIKPRADSLH